MGSDPEQLYPLQQFLNEFKLCGNFAFLVVPMIIAVSLANPDETIDLEEISEDTRPSLVTKLNPQAEEEYNQRIEDLVTDLHRLGYFRKIDF